MKTRTVLNLIIIAIFIIACNCQNKEKSTIEKTVKPINNDYPSFSLRQEWFPNANYAGAIFAKYYFAECNKINLEVISGSENIDPIKLVISGQNTFGDAGADRVLQAIDKGADLVIIGVLNVKSPTCFISLKDKNIKTPYDFINKSVGILTGTNTEYIYLSLVDKLGVDRKQIKEMEVSFDLKSFISGVYDVRPAFVYDEPVSLDMQKISYNIIYPENYGISFIGTVYFTSRSFMTENPKVVQAFINSVADGWRAAISYPEQAIRLLEKYDKEIDNKRELYSLKKGIPYFLSYDNKILWSEESDWIDMITTMNEQGIIVNKIDIKKYLINDFLSEYYKLVKQNVSDK